MGDMDDGFYPDGVERLVPRKVSASEARIDVDSASGSPPKKDASKGVWAERDILVVRNAIAVYLDDEVFADRFAACIEIIKRKNADYSQNEHKRDRIAAFKRIARDIGVPVRKAWAVFAQKHWGAVMRYVKDGFVESEGIDGRINDMINYLVLFGSVVEWEMQNASGEG